MRAVIELEAIGAHGKRSKKYLGYNQTEPYVAQILGADNNEGYKRLFKHKYRDYSRANGEGSRGVYDYYYLEPGVYEVNERLSWKRSRRYFIRVKNDGTYHEISLDDVELWLENAT